MVDRDDNLEDDFPVGDGDADMESVVECPYCWQQVEIALDPGGGSSQQYEEDCEVCCGPWLVSVHYSSSGAATVSVEAAES